MAEEELFDVIIPPGVPKTKHPVRIENDEPSMAELQYNSQARV